MSTPEEARQEYPPMPYDDATALSRRLYARGIESCVVGQQEWIGGFYVRVNRSNLKGGGFWLLNTARKHTS